MTAPDAQTIVAAFDIGSNSIKMTVASVARNGVISDLFSAMKTVRLGEGIDQTKQLAADRIEAAMAALTEMTDRASQAGATRLIGVATEAVRFATNGQEFLDRVERDTGIETVAITGDEEAELGYTGVLADTGLRGEIAMADIGGASTEIVLGSDAGRRWSQSFPVGSGRFTDSYVSNDPPTAAELDRCRDAAIAAFAAVPFATAKHAHLVLAGGTGEYLGRLIDDTQRITQGEIERVLDLLTTLTADQLAQRVEIPPIRARVLPAGIAIAAAIAKQLDPAHISSTRSGLRTGLLLRAAQESAK